MGKISDYTRVLAAKLADVFVVDQTDNGTTETKSATVEQIGTAIGTLQNFADLDTSNKNLVDAINEIASYTPVYGNTASGAIANFDTSLALPLQDLQIAINAVQEGSGTLPPSPSNVCPISGFTGANIKVAGANLWDEVVEEGYINSSGTPTANVNSLRSKNFLSCTPNTAYYCNIPEDVIGGLAVCWYDANQTFISRDNQTHNVTSPANAFYFRLSLYNYKGTYPSYVNNVSLNYPATDTAYHAYNANSTTTAISWQTEAGTVYGGSLDVTSGVLTVTWGSIDLGSLTWTYDSTYHRMKSNSISDMKRVNTARTLVFLCPIYQVITDGRSIANVPNDSIYASFDSDQKTAVWVHDSDYTDAGVFKTAMNGIYIVYPLETPVTYQLTPTQISAIVGTNNVFTDTNGDTSVVYACSLKDYIDSQ